MLPRGEILAWRVDHAPWADEDDVEQDLLLTRALCDVFADGFLREHLAFRGGTALHKLHLPPAARYSEDLDFVQREPEPSHYSSRPSDRSRIKRSAGAAECRAHTAHEPRRVRRVTST
jgi:predicted nucleotidyltransferase component of viral defense system